MTKEELKEAIASTIIENNQKGITATALANLLNEIVDAAGESGGSGSDILCLNLISDFETEEFITTPSVENLQFRQNAIERIINNKPCPIFVNICVDGSELIQNMVPEIAITNPVMRINASFTASCQYTNAPELGINDVFLVDFDTYDQSVEITINNDGSLNVEYYELSESE